MSVTDPVYDILLKKGPLISGDIQKILMNNMDLKRDASRKRIERSKKSGIIEKFIRISNKGYLYYLPDIHEKQLIKNITLNYLKNNDSRLFDLITILQNNLILSIEEICRLYNLKCRYIYYYNEKLKRRLRRYDSKINTILINLIKLGCKYYDKYLILGLNTVDDKSIISMYEDKMKNEYIVLTFALEFLENNGVNVEISNFRNNRESSLYSKFDALGKAGFKNIVSVTVECQTRRKVVISDLIGYKYRRGSSIRRNKIKKPIISYFVSNDFSDECINYARLNNIRLLIWKGGLNIIELEQDYTVINDLKKRGGRHSNLRGDALEFYIHNAYEEKDMNVQIKKLFYLDKNNEITEKNTGITYTDVDVFVINNDEVYMIECKSSKNKLLRKHILTVVTKYNKIANFIKQKYGYNNVISILICNFNELDAIDAKKLSKIPIQIMTLRDYYYQNKKLLKGVPKWLFVEDEIIVI